MLLTASDSALVVAEEGAAVTHQSDPEETKHRESGFSRRSSARAAKPDQSNTSWSHRIPELLSRTLVVVAILYAVVRSGGSSGSLGQYVVDGPTIQFHVCLMILAAIILSMLRPVQHAFPRPRVVSAVLVLWLSWLIFAAIQSVGLPAGVVDWISPGTTQLRIDFGAVAGQKESRAISLIPYFTRLVWPTYAIGLAFFLMGASVWHSRQSKTALLLAMTVGFTTFGVWGILQRANGSRQILPGIEAPDRAVPFATIVYKNAGASLVIAGIAVTIGLLLVMLRPALRKSGSRKKSRSVRQDRSESAGARELSEAVGEGDGSSKRRRRSSSSSRSRSSSSSNESSYSNLGYWTEPNVMATLVALCVLGIALVATLSRGGWAAGAVALVVWAVTMRKYVPVRVFVSVAFACLIMAVSGLYILGLRDDVAKRAGQSQLETLSENDRFTHWADAWETVRDYPFFGSGLGTYGYAQLPNQEIDSPRWFHHAHNQPLEWAVEMGFAGAAILGFAIIVVIVLLRDLYRRRRKGTTPLIWFSVLVIAVIAISLQSIFDFVLLTPAVLWTYALLLGVATGAVPDSKGESKSNAASAKRRGLRIKKAEADAASVSWFSRQVLPRLSRPFVWSLMISAGLLVGQRWLQDDILDESVLRTTRLPQKLTPTPEKVASARKRLADRANAHPINGKLWQRLAAWDVAAYRLKLLELGKTNGETLSWENTSISRLFQVLQSMTPQSRDATLKTWLSADSDRETILAARKHLDKAIASNPLVPQVHLQAAFLAPLSGDEYQGHAERCRSLSASNGNLQFANGVLALSVGDQETMKDQWRRCLRYTPENVSNVIRLADGVLSPEQIAEELLIDLRSSMWVAMIRQSYRDESMLAYRAAFVNTATKSIRSDKTLPDGQRHYYLAQLHEFTGSQKQAAHQYGEAVLADPANADYRYRYANALMIEGRSMEAREAAALGRALESGNKRWQEILKRIDAQIEAGPSTDSPASSEAQLDSDTQLNAAEELDEKNGGANE